MPTRESEAPPVDRLRDDIDRGKTGEKAPGLDPAAAPLGTDAEAAGVPPTPQERTVEQQTRPTPPLVAPAVGGRGRWAWGVGMLVLLVIVLYWVL
jgi:hypothetical protein